MASKSILKPIVVVEPYTPNPRTLAASNTFAQLSINDPITTAVPNIPTLEKNPMWNGWNDLQYKAVVDQIKSMYGSSPDLYRKVAIITGVQKDVDAEFWNIDTFDFQKYSF